MSRKSLSNLLTMVYLISAGLLSIATSKAGDGATSLAVYTMNYSVRSNCSNQAYGIDAFRVDQGVISQTIGMDGIARSTN